MRVTLPVTAERLALETDRRHVDLAAELAASRSAPTPASTICCDAGRIADRAGARHRRGPGCIASSITLITSCVPPDAVLSPWSTRTIGPVVERLGVRDLDRQRRAGVEEAVALLPGHTRGAGRAGPRPSRPCAGRRRSPPTATCAECRPAGSRRTRRRSAPAPLVLGRDGHVHEVLHRLARRRVHQRAGHHRAGCPRPSRARPRRSACASGVRPARRAVSAMSMCGIGPIAGDDGGVVDHARRHVRVEIERRRRSARRGAIARMRRSSSPSPSSRCSATMAPCRASKTASQPFLIASTMAVAHVLVGGLLDIARRVSAGRHRHDELRTGLLRHVEEAAELGIGVSELLDGRLAATSGRNEASGVGTGEKVFVSCIIIATTILRAIASALHEGVQIRRRQRAVEVAEGARVLHLARGVDEAGHGHAIERARRG